MGTASARAQVIEPGHKHPVNLVRFLVFSDDWGEHPSSCQHLFGHIGREHRVLWVNTVGMRSPKLTGVDLQKSLLKLRKMACGLRADTRIGAGPSNIEVIQPPMLPFAKCPGVRFFNRVMLSRPIRANLRRNGSWPLVSVATVPNACDFVRLFGEKRVIYYCVDDFSEWPGHDRNLIRKMEEKLIQKADAFVVTSGRLFERLSTYGKPAHLLTHGVDLDHFSRQIDEEHPLLKGIPNPRVGYFGLFDERSDQELLSHLAGRMREVSFVITGRVEVDITVLQRIPNIHFTGPVPYHELPSIVKGWRMCILPYVQNRLTDSINPLKLKEYLAAGKPVASSPLSEAVKLEEYIAVCRTPADWERNIRKYLHEYPRIEDDGRRGFLEKESWTEKARQFQEICLRQEKCNPLSPR